MPETKPQPAENLLKIIFITPKWIFTMATKIGLFVSDDELSGYLYKKIAATSDVFAFSFEPVRFTQSFAVQFGDIESLLSRLKTEEIKSVAIIGRIAPAGILDQGLHPSAKTILAQVENMKGEDIVKYILLFLKGHGIDVISLPQLLKDEFFHPVQYTKRPLEPRENKDITIGSDVINSMLKFRIGQSAAIKEGMVIAVEGVEGTDEMIMRAGRYCKDFVVVKMAGRDKDIRFDLPVIGPETIKTMISAGGRVVAGESDKTILFDREKCVYLCNKNRITLLGI